MGALAVGVDVSSFSQGTVRLFLLPEHRPTVPLLRFEHFAPCYDWVISSSQLCHAENNCNQRRRLRISSAVVHRRSGRRTSTG